MSTPASNPPPVRKPRAGPVVTVGLAVVDFVFTVPTLPTTPGKSFAQGYQSIVGGIAANAARAIAALGAPARLVTRLGADAHGQMAADVLMAGGVEITPDSQAAIPGTAVSAVCVDATGERMIVNHKQPALFGPPVDATVAVKGARAVMADLRWPDGAGAVLRAADGLPCLLDVDQAPEQGAAALLPLASHLIFGEQALMERFGAPTVADALARAGAALPGADMAVTQGGDGVRWRQADGTMGWVPAFKVPVVDTLGAGDVFHGAAALALAEGVSFTQALRFASAVAALKIGRSSLTGYFPAREDVDNLLEEAICPPHA